MKKIVARALQVFFRLLYHQFAWTYDFVAYIVSLGCWKDWVMTTLPYLEGPRIVELGFGPGHLQSELTRREVSVFGVDASPQMAKLTSLRMNKQGEQHHLSNAYAQQLPFPNESFDQIVATFPPEFILADSTYTEAFRVLAPGRHGDLTHSLDHREPMVRKNCCLVIPHYGPIPRLGAPLSRAYL